MLRIIGIVAVVWVLMALFRVMAITGPMADQVITVTLLLVLLGRLRRPRRCYPRGSGVIASAIVAVCVAAAVRAFPRQSM